MAWRFFSSRWPEEADRGAARSSGLILILILGLLGVGCGAAAPRPLAPKTEAQKMAQLLVDVAAQGVVLGDPLALPPELVTRAAREIGPRGSVVDRVHRLARWMSAPEGLAFRYDPLLTLTAAAAYQARAGDCLSYAHLFNALARSLGIHVEYVRFRSPSSYEERGGQLVVVSHVASLHERDRETILVDLSGEQLSSYRSDYQRLSDREALVLHVSNLAMAALGRGEVTRAERLSRRLLAEAPHLPDLHNNFGAVLLRRHQYAEALGFLRRSIRRFPTHVQLYVNASLAAQGAGDPALAAELSAKAEAPWTDPFVPFIRGAQLIDDGRVEEGVKLLQKVVRVHPQSATFQLHLARGLLQLGQRKQAMAAFTRASVLDPRHPMLMPLAIQLDWKPIPRESMRTATH
jgi:Flp pilus assembly protein TadD